MRYFTCANCSLNYFTSSNNPSSLIMDVLSGQPVSQMSLSHLAVLVFGFSFLGAQICNCFFSYAVLDDEVFCLSDNGTLFSIGVNDNLFKLIVSLRLLDALSCVTCHAEYPH